VKTSTEESHPQGGAQSIRRAISLLRSVAKYNDPGVRLSKIARDVALPSTTVHRMLTVLTEEGLIGYDPSTKLYNLGIALYILGSEAHQFAIRDQYHGIMEKIAVETEDTVYLMTRSGNDTLCVDRVVGSFPIQVLTFEIGERRPLGIGGGSQSILAAIPEVESENIIAANEKYYDEYNNRTADDVRKMVRKSKKLGYGLSAGNVHPDTIGVGVAIKNYKGVTIGAMSIAGISSRMSHKKQKEIVQLLKSEIKTVVFQKSSS